MYDPQRTAGVGALGIMALTAACSSTDSGAAPAASAPLAGPSSSALVASPAPSASAAATAPRLKETQETAAAAIGTLPEGVGLAVGTAAPDASVFELEGASVQLAEIRAKHGATLVVFYRGGWCPFCNFQIRELTKAFPDFQKRKVTPVVISVDRTEEAAKSERQYDIPFPVLSDPGLLAHRAFKVVHEAPQAEFEKLKSMGIDLEASSGKTHHSIAIPSIFLVDRAGTIRWAHADLDYKVRPSIAQLLAAVDAAKLD
jgi:peroxiredoxin